MHKNLEFLTDSDFDAFGESATCSRFTLASFATFEIDTASNAKSASGRYTFSARGALSAGTPSFSPALMFTLTQRLKSPTISTKVVKTCSTAVRSSSIVFWIQACFGFRKSFVAHAGRFNSHSHETCISPSFRQRLTGHRMANSGACFSPIASSRTMSLQLKE